MKIFLLITGSGPILIITNFEDILDPEILKQISEKSIKKFIAFEMPLESIKKKYGVRFERLEKDLYGSKSLRILDYHREALFRNISLDELGSMKCYEEKKSSENQEVTPKLFGI